MTDRQKSTYLPDLERRLAEAETEIENLRRDWVAFVEDICHEIAGELDISLEGGGAFSTTLNSVIRKARERGSA
jgi:hypothetical protein